MQTILKIDDDLQLVFGIALVADEIDAQGDVIDERELIKVASRSQGAPVKIDHEGGGVGHIACSFPLTTDIAKALGISRPGKPAWLVGLKVDDADTWRRVKTGRLSGGLSIGGRAIKEELR